MDFKKYATLLISFIVSLAGLIWQVVNISIVYFDYGTLTQLTMSRPGEITPPAFSLCFAHWSFKFGQTTEMYGSKYFNSPALAFEHTPTLNASSFVNCYLPSEKNDFSYRAYRGNRSKICGDLFSITKSNKQWKVCYTFQLRTPTEYKLHFIGNALSYNLITSFELNEKFLDHPFVFYYIKPIGYNLYGTSETYSEQFRQVVNMTTGNATANGMAISYKKITRHLLESPYKTDCFDYNKQNLESQSHCQDNCLTSMYLAWLDKVPFDVTIYENLTEPFSYTFKYDDHQIGTLRNTCSSICAKPDCFHETVTPKLISTEDGTKFYVNIYPPDEPDIITQHVPQMKLVDFVTYLLSCISFWFGFSPFTFLVKTKLIEKCHVKWFSRKQTQPKRRPQLRRRIKKDIKWNTFVAEQYTLERKVPQTTAFTIITKRINTENVRNRKLIK